jgi:hypothetical protein
LIVPIDGRVRGFSHQLCYSRGPYDQVSIYAGLADSPAAIVRGHWVRDEFRDRCVWIAALNVKYRDFRYVVPFIVQLGLYVSPVGFSASIVPDQWRLVYSLKPMVGVIDGFRWCLLGGENELYLPGLWLSLAVTGFFVWFGIRQFRKIEKSFADLI